VAELVATLGGGGDLGTVLRFVLLMTVVILAHLRTTSKVGTVSRQVSADPATSPTIEQQLANHQRDMQIRMSRLEGAFIAHQRDHLAAAPQVRRAGR
jgi:hypothetical protein